MATQNKTGRGRKGDGTILYNKHLKKYEARLSFGCKPDGSPDRRSKYAETKAGAKELLKLMKKEKEKLLSTKIPQAAHSLSMYEYYDKWLSIKKIKLKENSHIRLEQTIDKHILPEIGILQLGNVTHDHCQNIILKVIDKGLSYSSIKKVYNALDACFKHAMIKGDIARSPMVGVEMPEKNSEILPEEKGMLPFTFDECKRVIEEATRCHSTGTPVYRLGWLFVLMLCTGMRVGEALALKWSDIDWNRKTMRISKTSAITKLVNKDTGETITSTKIQERTKTKKGRRVIDLMPQALKALAELQKITGDFDVIASSKVGTLTSHRNILRAFHGLLRKLGLEQRGLHNLRHTFASRLFAKKVDIKIISELLGHASVQITLDIYVHIIAEQTREAIQLIDIFDDKAS